MTANAQERAGKRRIRAKTLVEALSNGEILEDYPNDPRGPSVLILGHAPDKHPLHAVCAFDPNGTLLVITVYEPTLPKWVDPQTRSLKGDQDNDK